jgi:hypothetical protein
MKLLRTLRTLTVTVGLLGVAACGDDDSGTGLDAGDVAGTYRATSLTTTSGGVTEDVLRAGGSLTLRLLQGGILTGHITVPSEGVNQDFAGTWRLEGNEVDVGDLPGIDSFVEDLEFEVRGNTLVGDRVFDGVRVQVVMTKQ